MDSVAASYDEEAVLLKLQNAQSNLLAVLSESSELNKNLAAADKRLSFGLETVAAASDAVAPLQTQHIAAKALRSRINRAVSPALSVLDSFALVESLQRRILSLSDDTSTRPHLSRLLKYVDCVNRLNAAIGAVTVGCEPAVLRLQEAVEFLSRTKSTDQLRIHRLRETLAAIKALYESEVDAMRYEGVFDEALLRLQDEYEAILQQIKHEGIRETAGGEDGDVDREAEKQRLGSELEVEVLGRISATLASNDCLDICIDIYVKVRYRRAAKALMRLNPRYLKTYAPEEIDKIEWEVLESAITLWIQHFQLAVNSVFLAEKHLCERVLSGIMDGMIWPACFTKIADKIMAVFFRFGEGVARSSKEPQKLFKLLDMYDSMDKIRSEFSQVFDGEPGVDICARFRELQKLLVHAASKVFWEFGLQIEGLEDGSPPPSDGSVPKIVRYAVNYLKCLAGSGYASVMGQALQIEKTWKAGYLLKAEPNENLLREAISNALDALQRNVEAKRSKYKDKITSHVLAMNTYWYMYMRTRGSELAKLVGEDIMKKKYKAAAEEAAYSYQAQAWGPLVKLLETEEESPRERMEVFTREFEEILRRHQNCYCVQDDDLRLQIRGAVVKIVVPAYEGFLSSHSRGFQERSSVLAPDSMREILSRIFGAETVEVVKFKRREFRKREDEEKVEGGSFGRREEKERGGERFRRKERGSFGRKGEQSEGRENSERNDERKKKEKQERAIVHGRREIKNVEEEEERVEGDEGRRTMVEGRRTMVEGEKRIFRRRREIKNEEENMEGEGEEIKREVEEAKTNFRRRRFKNRMEGGSGPLEVNEFGAKQV